MWSNSSMSNVTAAGGFMDESYSAGGQSGAQSGPKETVRGTNVVPLMLGHLQKCLSTSKLPSGTSIRMITAVAIVRKMTQVTTKVTYELEDETGTITAYKWLESDSAAPETVQLNTYVRIYGSIRDNAQVPYIFLMRVIPVTKYAEVFSHLCEVMWMSLTLKQMGTAQPVEDAKMDEDDDACHGLTTEQKSIYKIIKENTKDSGIERSEIKERVPQSLLSKVDATIEFLVGEGHIYTARTDNHFKAT